MEPEQLRELASQLSRPAGEFGNKVAEMMHETNISMTQSAISALHLKHSESVLEIGHGSCGHIEFILSGAEHLSYTGLEISELMCEKAKQISKELGLSSQCQFLLYDGEKLPFPDETFDKIMTVNTVYFWKDAEQFLKEIYRVLKPNGRFALAYGQETYMAALPFTAYGFTLYTSEKMQKLVETGQFQILEEKHFRETVESKIAGVMDREYSVVVLGKTLLSV